MASAATNLEIIDALLHPGPRTRERSLRPTSGSTLRGQSSADSVGSGAAAWKGAENRERAPEAGQSSSFFKKSKHVKVADSTFTNVAGNNVVHHHYHLYGVTPEYGLFAGEDYSGDSEKDEDSDGTGAQFKKSANSKRKKRRKSFRAPPLAHLSKSEPFRSLKVQKRLSHESLTPIDQPRILPSMPHYPRQGNHSQPELSTPNRNSLALRNEADDRAQVSWPRKKIILSSRQVPQVPPPTSHSPTDQDVYTFERGRRVVNHEYLKIHFWREGRLTTKQALDIIDQATNLFTREANLVTLTSPITVCGDLHGQYYDLMQIFEVGGSIKDSRYVFLGNYINHGFFGIETILYLFALKLRYPKQIHLLRGSHECREVAEFFHFKTECLRKYSEEVYEACLRSFWSLPLAALVDDRILCVHGGISPLLSKVENINSIQRVTDSPADGLLCDLLWSEPCPGYDDSNPEPADKELSTNKKFTVNTNQGRGHYYSHAAVCDFLTRNGLYTIIRGNDIQQFGYNMHQTTPNLDFPSVITLFSAPNHLDKHGNLGAVLQYRKGSSTIRTYNEKPHPYWLPNFNNVFAWSLPYINTQLAEMLSAVMDTSDIDFDMENPPELRPLAERKGVIKKKVLAVGRFSRAMRARREQPDNALSTIHHDSVPVTFSPEKDGGFEIIEMRISEGTYRSQPSTPYSVPTGQDFAVSRQSISGNKDPSQIHRMWSKLVPKNNGKADSEGFVNRRSIIQAKIKVIGKWQRLWKSASNSKK